MKNIYAAFVKAQAGFAPALKTNTNPHFKSKYADLAACVEAVIDSLNANGIGLIQKTHEDDTGVTVETVFVHESGECFDGGRLHVPAAKQDPQGYGSALSYARRYSLMAACGIAPEDDDGNAATKAKPAQQRAVSIPALGTAAAMTPVPDDEKPYLNELAEELTGIFDAKGPKAAFERMDIEQLNHEQLLYLSTKLASNVRNGIKAVSVERSAAKRATATQ